METRNFINRCITFFPVLFLAGYILFETVLQQFYHATYYYIFFIFFIITIFSGVVFIRLSEKNPIKFSLYYFAVTGVKLFLYLLILLSFIMSFNESAVRISIFYLSMYLIVKTFEIVLHQSFSRRLKK